MFLGGGFSSGTIFSTGKIFSWERSFQEDGSSRRDFHCGNVPEFLYEVLFGNCPGKIFNIMKEESGKNDRKQRGGVDKTGQSLRKIKSYKKLKMKNMKLWVALRKSSAEQQTQKEEIAQLKLNRLGLKEELENVNIN